MAKNKEQFDLHYQIHHDVSSIKKPKLIITCIINARLFKLKQSYFYLQLPHQWSSAKNLGSYVNHLHALEKNTHILNSKAKNLKKIQFDPKQKFITLRYEVYPKESTAPMDILKPIINADIFHFIGETALIYPKVNLNTPLKISIDSPYFGFNQKQKIAFSLRAIRNSVFAGGAYQQNTIEADDTITLLSYGLKKENTAYAMHLLNKIIPIQKSFWKDKEKNNTLIFMHGDDKAYTSLFGTCTTNALSLLINEQSPFLAEDLPEFLAHEYWHTWMGEKFYSAYSYKHMAWLFEGVTDYYAHKTSYQAGILSLLSWTKKYNRILLKHYFSSVKNKPNQAIIDFFDEDERYSDLPYTRGMILALELDAKIQALSHHRYSLDDVIKNLFLENKTSGITLEDFEASLGLFYPEAKDFVRLYIEQGQDLPLSSAIFNDEAKLRHMQIKPEEYGIDIKLTFIDKKITGLLKTSPAYQQGLRNGQELLSYEFDHKDINKALLLKVRSDNLSENSFLLERIKPAVDVPQYY